MLNYIKDVKISKIGIISDTHGLFRNEINHFFHDCNLIIHAGDIGKLEVIDSLKMIAPVIAIKGNVDNDEAFSQYQEELVISINSFTFLIIHNLKMLKHSLDNIDCIIYGHSHKSHLESIEGILYLNPGSMGPKRFNLKPSIAIIEMKEEITARIYIIE